MHAKVDCSSCHIKLLFTDIGAKCADCHADLHRGQFGAKCEQCHTVNGWNVSVSAIKEHRNRFPLLGAHAAVECSACHVGAAVGQFQGLRTDCVSCHLRDYRNTKALGFDHQALGFPTTCESCHTADTWFGANFDHSRTGFALVGAHSKLECTACHVGGKFQGLPVDCYSCHSKDYQGTTDPNHVAAAFPKDCLQCHTMASWQGATFDHTKFTKFPLTGRHVSVTCSTCHIGGKFAGTPTTCVACHLKDYNGTTNPNHASSGFPQTCDTCHTTAAWVPASFDHNKTPFPLTGAHLKVACSSCHTGGKFAGTPTACYACHTKDYQGTTNPNHTAAGFPTDCSICHSTSSWLGAVFDHSKTKFPLTGAHITVACSTCHVNGQYATLPTTCVSCHLKEFNGTTNPNHAAAGFPQTCETCHNTSSWLGATFDHNKTAFPLTGVHLSTPCSSCHVGGKFKGTPTDCYSCHKPEYQGTTSPNHVAAGFPITCQTCHSTSSWLGATFNHTWFRIPHHNAQCSDCHTNSTNYTVFTCTICHTQAQTDPKHRGVQGYVWNSANCYACHKGGGN